MIIVEIIPDWFRINSLLGEGGPPVVVVPQPPRPIDSFQPPVPLPQPAPSPKPAAPKPAAPAAPARPKLSDLLAVVNTYDGESGFCGGTSISKAKDLLEALYESPDKLRQVLMGMSSDAERDDAVASFLRTLFESGPAGSALVKSLPMDIKKALAQYVGSGDSWSSPKDAVYLTLLKMIDPSYYKRAMDATGLTINGVEVRSHVGFNSEETARWQRRYQEAQT